jgi:uroporphyrinogen-III synthase
VVAYRTVAGHPDAGAVAGAGRCDAIAFTSSSTVNRTIEVLGVEGIPPVIVSIGPVTSGAARAAGLEVTVEADPHTIEGVVDALVAALDSGYRPDPAPERGEPRGPGPAPHP